jgi:hypothetical protein
MAKARREGNQFIALQHTALHMPVAANLKHPKEFRLRSRALPMAMPKPHSSRVREPENPDWSRVAASASVAL